MIRTILFFHLGTQEATLNLLYDLIVEEQKKIERGLKGFYSFYGKSKSFYSNSYKEKSTVPADHPGWQGLLIASEKLKRFKVTPWRDDFNLE